MRLVALVMALCLATDAYSKVLVVSARNAFNPTDNSAEFMAVDERFNHVVSTLQSLGVDYDIMPGTSLDAKTEFFRTGTVVYGFGTPAARPVRYSAIIHVGSQPLFSTGGGRGYRPDSLTLIGPSQPRTIKYVQVPNIIMQYNGTGLSQTSSDSTLLQDSDNTNQSILGQTHWAPGTTATYRAGVAKVVSVASSASSWAGGSRILIEARTGDGIRSHEGYGSIPRLKGDSLLGGFGANTQTPEVGDSVIVFAKKFDNIPACNGAAILFVQDSDFNTSQMDPVAFLTALTYADSLTSGAVFSNATRMPAKLGLQIRGAFSRGTQLGWPTSTGGMTETDSANFIASIDSLASLNIPFVVGVNIDSLETYANFDKRWWSRAPWAKFGVYQTTGAMTVGPGVGNASFDRPLDILGLRRNRAAFGDSLLHTIQTSDTSITQLVRGAYAKLDTQFGASRVDRILMAPNDDWVPLSASTLGVDSVVFALRKGGAKGLTLNSARATTSGTTYGTTSRKVPVRLADPGTDFSLLVTHGFMDSGSVIFDISLGAGQQHRWNSFQESAWRGLLQGYTRTPVISWERNAEAGILYNFSITDSTHYATRGTILTIHCSDLQSGTRGDAALLPLRPAWHAVKNIARGMDTINRYAWKGRKVVTFAYPQDIEP
jgi:hypothetical protein